MKFATLKNSSRDGQLVLVSRDLTLALDIKAFAPTMQYLLENWNNTSSKLESLYQQLNNKELREAFNFDEKECMAPLPRAYQWCDGSAFLNHGVLLQKAFNLPPQDGYEQIPLMYQGASDTFIGPRDSVYLLDENHGIDFEGEFAVILDDVPMGCSQKDALSHIRLITLVNDISLRDFIQREMKSGFGFLQAKPSSSFSPVAVTPDELGKNWKDARVCLPLNIKWNNQQFGNANGSEMNFSFAQLIAHAAFSRKLGAGTIIGSGTVSNKDSSKGSSCIAERRALDMIEKGRVTTEFMKFGDRISMETLNENEENIFGTIDQVILKEK